MRVRKLWVAIQKKEESETKMKTYTQIKKKIMELTQKLENPTIQLRTITQKTAYQEYIRGSIDALEWVTQIEPIEFKLVKK